MRNRGQWSKYGAGTPVLIEVGEQWTCQSCASTLTKEFCRHEYNWEEKFVIGVCDLCVETDVYALRARVSLIEI